MSPTTVQRGRPLGLNGGRLWSVCSHGIGSQLTAAEWDEDNMIHKSMPLSRAFDAL